MFLLSGEKGDLVSDQVAAPALFDSLPQASFVVTASSRYVSVYQGVYQGADIQPRDVPAGGRRVGQVGNQDHAGSSTSRPPSGLQACDNGRSDGKPNCQIIPWTKCDLSGVNSLLLIKDVIKTNGGHILNQVRRLLTELAMAVVHLQ